MAAQRDTSGSPPRGTPPRPQVPARPVGAADKSGERQRSSRFLRRGALTGKRVGRYFLGPRLGTGGAATVYMGRLEGPHGFSKIVAVKIIHEHLADQPDFVSMFLDEARIAARLQHSNIVTGFELAEAEQLCFVMELLQGQPLSRLVDCLREQHRTMTAVQLAYIGREVARGLAYAHDLEDEQGRPLNVVHRDVSPDNVFLTYDGKVKLIDFGIAKAEGRNTKTELGMTKGKSRYMAPEQALGKPIDGRADVFALAATVYGAALQRPVFDATDARAALAQLCFTPVAPPADLIEDFDPALSAVISGAMTIDPEARCSAAQLAEDLDAFLQQQKQPPHPSETLGAMMSDVFAGQKQMLQTAVEAMNEDDDDMATRVYLGGLPGTEPPSSIPDDYRDSAVPAAGPPAPASAPPVSSGRVSKGGTLVMDIPDVAKGSDDDDAVVATPSETAARGKLPSAELPSSDDDDDDDEQLTRVLTPSGTDDADEDEPSDLATRVLWSGDGAPSAGRTAPGTTADASGPDADADIDSSANVLGDGPALTLGTVVGGVLVGLLAGVTLLLVWMLLR